MMLALNTETLAAVYQIQTATDVEVTTGNHFPKVENMWTFKLATVKPN